MTPQRVLLVTRVISIHMLLLAVALTLGSAVALAAGDAPQKSQVVSTPQLGLDGPHVFVTDQGFEVIDTELTATEVVAGPGANTNAGPNDTTHTTSAWRPRKTTQPAHPLPTLTVRVDNPSKTRFDVTLRTTPAPSTAVVDQTPSRLLMLSDMEGEFDKFVDLLRAQGVIDAAMHWTYDDGHLLLLGDFVDRGQHMVPLLWLIYRLEAEAAQAGGRLHYVLGNHEQMALSGRTSYWPPHLIATALTLGAGGNTRLFAADSVLGAWLRSKPVITRVGEMLFVHAGISQEFLALDLDIDASNAAARPWLETETKLLPQAGQPLLGRNGVTWYRGMALPADPAYALEADPEAHLKLVLARYGAKRLAIAHTIVPHVVLEQRGLLLRLDVHHAEQTPEAALLEDGVLWRVTSGGERTRLE